MCIGNRGIRNKHKIYKTQSFNLIMWFGVASKKEVNKEFHKIRNAFKQRDKRIEALKQEIKLLQSLISKERIEAMIKEIISSIQYEPNPIISPALNQTNYERVMVQKAMKTRPELIKQAIRGLIDKGMRTTDIYRAIVEEKRLISKTQFYHYLGLVRNEQRTKLHTELRTEPSGV